MSQQTSSRKSNELVHSEAPKHTETRLGHDGTNYEGTDAAASTVLTSLALIGGTLIVVFLMTVGIQKYIQNRNPVGEPLSPLAPARVVPPAPQLQVQPWEDLPQMRAHENQVLTSSGKDAEGHFHIPINSAMSAVISRLKIEDGAAQGLTTQGGMGRDFAGSLADMPAAYQKPPAIRGEIQKHAQ